MKSKFISGALALSSLAIFGSPATAQEFPPVYVLSKSMTDHTDGCGYTHTSIEAAVKSELRHNRIPIATDTTGKEIWAYIETIGDDRVGYAQCSAAIRFSLVYPQQVEVWATKEWRSVKMEFCHRWGTVSGRASDMQPTLNTTFRDFTGQCITEYLENGGIDFR